MKPLPSLALLVGLPLLAGAPALAASPGPSARQGLLGLGVCEGGAFAGERCVDAGDCDDGSGAEAVCSSDALDVEVRGFLTLVSDKDAGRVESLETVPYETVRSCAGGPIPGRPCQEDADCQGPQEEGGVCREELVPSDFSRSTLTLILEFTRDGERFVLAETYKDLGDFSDPELGIECRGFCVPTWREPAVEPRIANPEEGAESGAGGGGGGGGGGGTGGGGGGRAGGAGIRIQWASAPPALARALVEALGLPEGSRPFLEFASTTAIADRSAEDDPLATVRTIKVTIRALGPPAP